MKIFAPLVMLSALFACATPALAQSNEHSSPKDRRRFVAVVQSIERAPLSPKIQNDRGWAIAWLIDAPDISVTACLTPLGGLSENDYSHAAEITVQYMLGMGAYIIEHPDQSNDSNAQQLAGVESALTAYRSIRFGQGEKPSPVLEKLLAMKTRDELPGFVRNAFKQCSAEGAENIAR